MGINLTIKDLSVETGQALKEIAKESHRSLNAEIKFQLDQVAAKRKRDPKEILALIRKHRESLPFMDITNEELTAWKNEGRE